MIYPSKVKLDKSSKPVSNNSIKGITNQNLVVVKNGGTVIRKSKTMKMENEA